MKSENTFGTIRLHRELIDRLKNAKRQKENDQQRDLTWDEFIEGILEKKTNNA